MAFKFEGNYLFPTDIGDLVVLFYSTTDYTRQTLYNGGGKAELETIIKSRSTIEASCLNILINRTYTRCNSPIQLTEIGNNENLRHDNGIWRSYRGSTISGTFSASSTSSGSYYSAPFGVLVRCSDGYMWLYDYVYGNYSNISAELGYSLPSPDKPGYFVFNKTENNHYSVLTIEPPSGGFNVDINTYFTANPPKPSPIQPTDPYDAGGTSETGGGEGDFDGTSDSIDIPALPTVSAVDAGFITLFNPTLAELKSLSSYMWSGLFDVATFRKLFADPMDAILGLSLVPVAVPDGSSTEVTVGNIPTGVYMTLASSQYVEVDCGTLNINEYWGAYLDYEPYTRAELYLPYIGMHAISVDDIMGKAVSIKYHVDVLSGACVAYVKCGDSVLYSYVGQCSMQIPLTSTNWASAISAALNLAGSIGMTIASGGLSAPVTAASVVGVASSAASAANQIKPSIQRSGAMAGTGGYMANQKPYIILTRPRQCLPADQNKILGYPSFVTMDLSELEGYTQIAEIHLSGIPATSSELAEIESLLKEGVIF